MELAARQRSNKPGFVVNIPADPLNPGGKWTTRGMGTKDKALADSIAVDAGRLLDRRSLLQDPEKHLLDLSAYHIRAVSLILGEDHPVVLKLQDMKNPQVGLTTEDLDGVRNQIEKDNAARQADLEAHPENYADQEYDEEGRTQWHNLQPPIPVDPQIVSSILSRFMPEKVRSLNERVVDLERECGNWRARAEQAERELSDLRRDLNRHVTTTIPDAASEWYGAPDFNHLAAQTRHETRRAVDSFLASLPTGFKLADLQASHVLTWRDSLRSLDGKPLAPRTILKNTMYLRSFMTSVYVRYDLRENVMDKISSPGGANSRRENVVAIRDVRFLQEMLKTLEKVSPDYWHPLVATAVLAGPRYGELVWLRLDDINLEQGYIRIGTRRDDEGTVHGGTKTGRERLTPIEKSILRPLLRDYIEKRKDEAKMWPWLFPSFGLDEPRTQRTKSLPGQWSDPAVFHRAWQEIVKKCEAMTGPRDFWNYGPREWRHCAGTAMGHSGNDSARICAWLGNSEAIARRFYCVAPTSGTLWPYKW